MTAPPTLPLLGNIHQIPAQQTYLKAFELKDRNEAYIFCVLIKRFTEWSKKYGGLYMLHIAHQKTIVISDRRIVKELMEKKQSLTSGRPAAETLNRMLYDNDEILLMQASDPQWRTTRKYLHQNFMISMVEKTHMQLINAEAVQMLKDILDKPESFMQHTKRFANSFMMSIGYGIRTPTVDTKHMVQIGKVMSNTTKLLQPGGLPPLDIFPFLRYVPQRLLGSWRDKIDETHKELNDLHLGHLDLVLERRARKGRVECFADRLIEQQKSLELNRHQQAFMIGILIEAGSDTTSSAMNAVFNLITAHQKWAHAAQREIDSVVGEGRSPEFSDFGKLPIVSAIVKETLRLRPIAPLGFPHALKEGNALPQLPSICCFFLTTADVWIDGKLLPKGSDLIVNIYAIHQDPDAHPNPNEFNPGRYLDKPALSDEYAHASDYRDRDHYAYGIGRRLCPGIHLAERALFVTVAKALWAFEFSPKYDSDSVPMHIDITSETGYDDGVAIGPLPYPCDITVRSMARRETILAEFARAQTSVFPLFSVPEE
ncbi:hypothetical protein yc1106_01390 [Curvularia clavata]|uniref:Cytochrome P450 n=1 Tax=Curvularia clavata TaxID=95742 RepID=A0A9Q8Z1C1_CURCL|nr:hypothetical protein yc1106_01390 [Curvularia clavata]